MRAAVVVLALELQADSYTLARRILRDSPPCVATEHMPIAGLYRRSIDPMPVARVDGALRWTMPVLRLRACYLVDASAPRHP